MSVLQVGNHGRWQDDSGVVNASINPKRTDGIVKLLLVWHRPRDRLQAKWASRPSTNTTTMPRPRLRDIGP